MGVKVVFMGTPDFAVPTLEALVAQGWDVLVVTQPDKKVGRKHVITPPPVKVAARKHGLRVLQPTKVREEASVLELQAFQPDLIVTAAYGQLLPASVLSIPRVGAVNVHASLLPRWRGAAPIHRAIMAGDTETGVTIMEMVQALDAGPMLERRAIPILNTDNVGSLHDKLAQLGAQMCQQVLPRYVDGALTATEQPEQGVTYAARIERADEFIDWTGSVTTVDQHIRGLSPWPGATAWDGEATYKIWSAHKVPIEARLEPGEVRRVGSDILVGCLDGILCLDEVQPSGRRKMAARDWFGGIRQDAFSFVKGSPS
ncbi:methionyl-tRNA formyltransferase [Alicyclobacillus fastidiosus]|uniref:Methionyl-tRNA formyltransferase n=1 Tax=Alicyclobacillus fastidiosus TaxID=392011 RepID=A0ABY6ZNU3_9BACL|nr:methionyl-tRNA formyltransferase [Alicyclobacillus fastidiosus]WAH44668.1 methionyl-tRNA formyltransferase [Alicyclobacillus fastidiosus]